MDVYSVDSANLELYVEQLKAKFFSKLQFDNGPSTNSTSTSTTMNKQLKSPGTPRFD